MLLLQAYQHVFIGPSAVKDRRASKSGRGGNAEIHGMTEVTYESICYIAVLVHLVFSLIHRSYLHSGPVCTIHRGHIHFWQS